MTPENLAILIIGGLGALLLVIGIGIAAAQKNKIRHCTKMTAGRVIRHRYHGDGRVNPMIEYEVEGQMYTVPGVSRNHHEDQDIPRETIRR